MYRATYENGHAILVNADTPEEARTHAEQPEVNLTPACQKARRHVVLATNVPAVRNGPVVSVECVDKVVERWQDGYLRAAVRRARGDVA